MIEFEAYDIDGVSYLALDKLTVDGEEYLYLSNENDPEDVMFRKIDKTDRNFIIPLDSEEEVIKVAEAFNNNLEKKRTN